MTQIIISFSIVLATHLAAFRPTLPTRQNKWVNLTNIDVTTDAFNTMMIKSFTLNKKKENNNFVFCGSVVA